MILMSPGDFEAARLIPLFVSQTVEPAYSKAKAKTEERRLAKEEKDEKALIELPEVHVLKDGVRDAIIPS